MSTAVQSPQRPDQELEQIERALDTLIGRLLGAWKKILVLLVLGFLLWALVLPSIGGWWQYILYGAFLLFQLLFAILFMIVQFVALFWFLGRPRMYWILPGETGVGFKDYKGNPEVLEVARRIVTLLKGVKEFKQMGGEVIRGVLLIGPPGTGKSYLGQCISTEAGVPFGYLSAPSIQGMFWGMDVLRIWSLYNKARKLARKYGACIVFIDEIDAIGARRGAAATPFGVGALGGLFGGGYGALNQLLTELDPLPRDDSLKARLLRRLGLKTGKAVLPPVLTMAATNLPEALDPALLRPGRFDRKIVIDLPDFDGRKEIIEYYLSKVAHEPMDLDRLAYDTIGYSPVAIKYVINEAVIQAHFEGRNKITYEDFTRAREVYEWGLRQPIKSMSMEDRRRLAYHEAGHAIAMHFLYRRERLTKVTIVRYGGALGLAAPKPKEEIYTRDKNEILADIKVSLASRAAEELFLGTQLSGVYSDLQHATQMAMAYIGLWGMGGSLVSIAAMGGTPNGALHQQVDRLLKEQYREVKRLLDENREAVIAVAETLLEKLELNGDEVAAIVREVERRKRLGLPPITMPALDAPAQRFPVDGQEERPAAPQGEQTAAAYQEGAGWPAVEKRPERT
jgi:ATP-dependent metalloprotease FtsH